MLEGDSIEDPIDSAAQGRLPDPCHGIWQFPNVAKFEDEELWFEKSRATVNVVLCLKLIERSNTIKVEKWTSDPANEPRYCDLHRPGWGRFR